MRLHRYLALLISITSILFLAGLGWAKETPEAAFNNTGKISAEYTARLKRIADQQIEMDQNTPMRTAVDNYMLMKKAEEDSRKKMETIAQERANEAQEKIESEVTAGQSEQTRAEQILDSLIARNPLLQGATVYIRQCPHNWQGCVYYKTGVIWIDPDHKASLEKIMAHECDHIIDWRTDGDIDNNDYHE